MSFVSSLPLLEEVTTCCALLTPRPLLLCQVREDEAAFILTTTHKYKGKEHDYVQLADDFACLPRSQAQVQLNSSSSTGSECSDDEYNLVYVAATRAKKALFLNADLSQLLSRSHKAEALPVQVITGTHKFVAGHVAAVATKCLKHGNLTTSYQCICDM